MTTTKTTLLERTGTRLTEEQAKKMCLDKTAFRKSKAEYLAFIYTTQFKKRTVYRCPICGSWHIKTIKRRPK